MSNAAARLGLAYTRPGAAHKREVLRFAEQFYAAGERVINGSGGLDFYLGYEAWLAYLARVDSGEEEGLVPSQIWLARNEDGRIVGIVDIRPALPPEKAEFGHIGYSVAPPFRRKGYAAELLRWGTARLKAEGVSPVTACCYRHNVPSVRTLEKGGYIATGSYTDPENGEVVLVFSFP